MLRSGSAAIGTMGVAGAEPDTEGAPLASTSPEPGSRVSLAAGSHLPSVGGPTQAAMMAPVSTRPPHFEGGGAAGPDLENPHQFCTLQEPVIDTIMRDVRSIGEKLMYVLMPIQAADRGQKLKDWDLWGPLMLCLGLGLILAVQADGQEQASYAFADVFVTIWVGSAVVTFNALLLQGKVSFFQTVCVLGYCIFPLVIAAFLAMLLQVRWLKAVLVAIGLAWAAKASAGFVSELVPTERKLLGLYPVMLFYVAIAWMILLA